MSDGPTDRKPLSKTAIAVGASIGVIVPLVVMLGATIVAMIIVAAKGQATDDGLLDVWLQETQVLVAFNLVGAAGGMLGGFVASRIGGRDHLWHGIWTGVVLLALFALLILIPVEGTPSPLWSDAMALMLAIPACATGGWLGRDRIVGDVG